MGVRRCLSLCRPAAVVRPLGLVILQNGFLILLYYALSIGLTFFQNRLLKEIHFPLTVVLCHLVVKFLLATIFRIGWELCKKEPRVLLDCDNWMKRLSLIGISGGLDIAFSNWGQEFITVSLYTMSKSTAIIFILGFALFFKLEEKHWSLIVIVSMISGGLFMFTYESTQFELRGFLLIISASFLSGLRWTMCQVVVQRSSLGLSNPIDMVFHVQPWMMAAVLPFALYFEWPLLSGHQMTFESMANKAALVHALEAILAGAFMAFAMEVAEYLVISHTSSLTFSVAGIFKEICTLGLAVLLNGDTMSWFNFIGLLLCFCGIVAHVAFKFAKSAREMELTPVAVTSSSSQNGADDVKTVVFSKVTSLPVKEFNISSEDDEVGKPLLRDPDSDTDDTEHHVSW